MSLSREMYIWYCCCLVVRAAHEIAHRAMPCHRLLPDLDSQGIVGRVSAGTCEVNCLAGGVQVLVENGLDPEEAVVMVAERAVAMRLDRWGREHGAFSLGFPGGVFCGETMICVPFTVLGWVGFVLGKATFSRWMNLILRWVYIATSDYSHGVHFFFMKRQAMEKQLMRQVLST